jgi:hypothetical protein
MPTLSARFTEADSDLLGSGLLARMSELLEADEKARRSGAKAAAQTTRRSFRYAREVAPKRPGRSSTGGQLGTHLTWGLTRGGMVAFNVKKADTEAKHWIIQEIGTGQRATIQMGIGKAAIVRTVPSQRGRPISGGLVFARGGRYSPPGAARDEQLFPVGDVRGVPRGPRGGLRITREIKGQHFVQKGGREGFRVYRNEVLAAARRILRKR